MKSLTFLVALMLFCFNPAYTRAEGQTDPVKSYKVLEMDIPEVKDDKSVVKHKLDSTRLPASTDSEASQTYWFDEFKTQDLSKNEQADQDWSDVFQGSID